jgi:hypothetical protein
MATVYIIRILGHAAGSGSVEALFGMVVKGEEPPERYIKTFDHEAHGGQGYATFTNDPRKALAFPTWNDAHEFWRKVPKCRPTRPDGKPNRPLTASSIEVVKRED